MDRIKKKVNSEQNVMSIVTDSIYKYKLTNIRFLMFLFGILSICISLKGELYSIYLIEILEIEEKTSKIILKSIVFSIGMSFLLISLIFFEYIQIRKFLYIRLGIINILLGIVFTKVFYCILNGKEILINNNYIKLENFKPLIKIIEYIKK